MSQKSFFDIPDFVRAPRISGLKTNRAGEVVVTRRAIDADGAAFVDQLFSVTANSARQLTFGDSSASLLAVGERGEVYFRREDPGSKEKGGAIWMLPPTGEAREIFRYKAGIMALAATTTHLFLTLRVLEGPDPDEASAEELLAYSHDLTQKREKQKVTAVLHDRFPTRFWDSDIPGGDSQLFVTPVPPLEKPLDLSAAETKGDTGSDTKDDADEKRLPDHELVLTQVKLPKTPDHAHQFALSSAVPLPDSSLVLAQLETRNKIRSKTEVWVLDPTNQVEPRLLACDPMKSVHVAAVPDSGNWVLLEASTPPLAGQPVAQELQRVELATGAAKTLSDHEMTQVVITADDKIFFTADRLGRGGIYRLEEDGSATLLTPDDEYTYSALAATGNSLVALRSSVAAPADVVFLDPATSQITANTQLVPPVDLPGLLTEISAESPDGTQVRGWLAVPETEGPHPLVVFAHGGPWGSWNDWTWRWNPWVFVARGYAVLLPDPGISTGYGKHIAHRGHDAIGQEPFQDIMALTDAAIERQDIDEECQMFAGGSYGGYMANWVAGHTGDRFKRIVTHASLWNIESMGRTTDNGSWYEWMMAPVGEGPSQAETWSPHMFVEDIEVPMLVIHGADDHRVPVTQGLELWMDLQRTSPELGHQYLYYPDEGHWILKPGNAQVWYETFLDFLDQGQGLPPNRPELLS